MVEISDYTIVNMLAGTVLNLFGWKYFIEYNFMQDDFGVDETSGEEQERAGAADYWDLRETLSAIRLGGQGVNRSSGEGGHTTPIPAYPGNTVLQSGVAGWTGMIFNFNCDGASSMLRN